MEIITSTGGAVSISIVGKINLSAKKNAGKKPAKKYFKPFSGGYTLAERLKAAGISLR